MGGDISEPVSQATLRIVKVFWGLDSQLAYRRHFPAINWLKSYSLYLDMMEKWYAEQVAPDWMPLRNELMRLLQEEAELDEIVKLVGMDALNAHDRMKLEAARSIREDYLHQDAFHEVDTYASLPKQRLMMRLILDYYEMAVAAVDAGANMQKIIDIPIRERIGRIKYVAEADVQAEYDAILVELQKQIDEIKENGGE